MRPTLYATMGALLVILAAIGVTEVRSFRIEFETIERQRLQTQLDDTLDAWEREVESTLGELRVQLSTPNAPRDEFLRRRRLSNSWLDSYYQWDSGLLTFPPEAPVEDIAALRAHPCLARAADVQPGTSHLAAAIRYRACITGIDPVSAFASSEAAERLLAAGRPGDAFALLRQLPAIGLLRFDRAAQEGISPYRVLSLRLEYIEALGVRSDPIRMQSVLNETIAELLTQDGPILEQVQPLYDLAIAGDLQGGPDRAAAALDVDEVWARPQRRIRAWRDLRDRRWSAAEVEELAQHPSLLVEPDGEPPYLLYVSGTESPGVLVAFQLDQDALLRVFKARFGAALAEHLTVRDGRGEVLIGENRPFLVYRNPSRVLPRYLQVGFTEAALAHANRDRALFAQVGLIGVGLVIGAAALFAVIRSDRETKHLLDSQREFLTRVTHELKTPLAGIRVMAEGLEMGAWSTRDDVTRASERIMSETDRLGMRVEEVLRASRGVVDESPSPTDATELLEAIAAEWRPRIEQVGGTLTIEAPAHLRTSMRRGLVRDALTNLLDNALKYRREDRPLTVVARVSSRRRQVVFEVVDNGLGVPPAMRSAVFERFRRVEGPGRGRSGGHGLGLAFVADAARASGGGVECRDGTDGGARFVFRIPFRPVPADPPSRRTTRS